MHTSVQDVIDGLMLVKDKTLPIQLGVRFKGGPETVTDIDSEIVIMTGNSMQWADVTLPMIVNVVKITGVI